MTSKKIIIIASLLAIIPLAENIFPKRFNTYNSNIVFSAQRYQDSKLLYLAKSISVRIEGATKGSGVIVKKEGDIYTVLTAWHVIKDNLITEEVGIITSDNEEHIWEPINLKRLGKVDLALFTFRSKNLYKTASIGDAKVVNYKDQVYVAGFSVFDFKNLKFEKGEIVANAEVGIDNGYQMLYSNKTTSGMSGGVILDKRGRLIGIHGRGEVDLNKSSISKIKVKTGINQGIPITFFEMFNKGLPVELPKGSYKKPDDYLAQAWASQEKEGREQSVLRLVNQALKINRFIPEAYFLKAYINGELNNYQLAIQNYTEAIKIDPNNSNSFINRGLQKKDMGNIKGALNDFNKAIKLDPNSGAAYHARALSLDTLGRIKDAMNDYNYALELEPSDGLIYYNRGSAKYAQNDFKGALIDFNNAIENNELGADVFYNRALTKYNLRDLQGSLKDYSSSILIDPSQGSAYANRGLIRGELGDEKGLCLDAKKAASLEDEITKNYLRSDEGAWCRNMTN